ncbi:hypothetical protein BJ741DRAFT_601655, partial [Chytriomyces cf. hyalinus JEL632]
MRTYCNQGRISSGSCAAVQVSQLASVAHVVLHASALVVMWVGVSMLSSNPQSRSIRTRRETHWTLSQKEKCADQTHVRRVGARVLFASFLMQGVAELLSAASLVIAYLVFARDPFLSQTDERLKRLEDDSRSYHSLSLGVSAQLLMASLALNTLMSIITFFRYKSAIFPSSNKNNKNGNSDTPSSLEVQHNSIRRNSSDTGYSNADETHNPSLFNDRFDAWAKSATAANPYTLPIHMHTLSKNDAISTMQPSIIHETKSNHSGGSAHHHRIHPTPASPSASLPIGLPSLFHDTKSNHSNGSMYNGSSSFTPIPAQSISPRTSATMDESSMLVQRRSRRKSGSTPPIVPGLLPKFPLPSQHGSGVISPVSGAIMAVVPPRDGEWDEIDFQLFGASEYRGITVEYIEMKPAAVVGAENGSSKAAPTMMGTVVFDD